MWCRPSLYQAVYVYMIWLICLLCFSDTAAFTAYTDAVLTTKSSPAPTVTTTTTNTVAAATATIASDVGVERVNIDDVDVTSARNDVAVAVSNGGRDDDDDNDVTRTPSTAVRWRHFRFRSSGDMSDDRSAELRRIVTGGSRASRRTKTQIPSLVSAPTLALHGINYTAPRSD